MRRVIASEYLTLDGVMEAPGSEDSLGDRGGWSFLYANDEAAAFKFDGSAFGNGHPVYWIYGFKTGTWWPFVPTGEKQERDNAQELELKAKLEKELPVEPDLSKWLALFDAPI